MKKLLFFLFIACFATTGYSQDMAIAISGLDNTMNSTRMLIQKATPDGENTYVIVKAKDRNSIMLKEAATTRRVFTEIRLMQKFPNGVLNETKLTNVVLMTYSENGQGTGATETFMLQFEDELQMH